MKRHPSKRTILLFLTLGVLGVLIANVFQTQPREEADRQTKFAEAGAAGEPAFPFRRNQLWGFLDRNGRVSIPPMYRHTTGVQDGRALVWIEDNVCVIDQAGTVLSRLPNSYLAWWAAKDRIWLKDKETDLYALFDDGGKVIIPPTYQDANSFQDGFAAVASDGEWKFPGFLEGATYRYINVNGNNVFGKTFDDTAWDFHDGYAVADDAVIDRKGNVVFETPDGCDFQFSQGWISVDDYGPPRATKYLDAKGRVVLQVPLRSEEFSEGLAAFAVEVTPNFENDDTTSVLRWGYLDRDGTQVIPPTFTSAQPFQNGLAAVGVTKLKGTARSILDQERIGFIERSGKMVIPAKYNDTKGFSNDRCLVHQGGEQPEVMDGPTWWERGRWLLIDKSGDELAVTEVDEER